MERRFSHFVRFLFVVFHWKIDRRGDRLKLTGDFESSTESFRFLKSQMPVSMCVYFHIHLRSCI